MLKIRLQRVGRKHEPSFRLVLTDSKNSTKSGKYLEVLGSFDSRRGEDSEFKGERITYWISKGAQISPTVHNLLINKKVITGKKINTLPLKKAIKKEEKEEKEVAAKKEVKAESKAEEVEEAPSPETNKEDVVGIATAEVPSGEVPAEKVA